MQLQQDQRQTITQRIDPKIILANSILQLNTQELVQTVEAELADNPALDNLDDPVCSGCLDPNCPYCGEGRPSATSEESQTEALDTNEEGEEYASFSDFQAVTPLVEDDYDPVGNLEAELTLQDHLRSLLRAAVPAEDYPIGEYLISCLNERGWLEGAVEEIALELEVEPERVERILKVIQRFNDPPGIGARNLQECLLLQLEYLQEEEHEDADRRILTLTTKIIRDHFDYLPGHKCAKLARATGASVAEIKQCAVFITKNLHFSPASQFRAPWTYSPTNSKQVVRPDVIIHRGEYGYEVEVPGSELFALGVNPFYREEYNHIKQGKSRHSLDEKKHVLEYVERAELFIKHIQQRRLTLQQITRCIIDEQQGYLATGERRFLRPLTRTRVAKLQGLHESTVSRATANKFVQLPNHDVVSFEIFFDPSLAVKEEIETLIDNEDPSNPLSDKQIVEKLQEKGIEVARRTIVKYREDRKILSSNHRRRP